MVVLRYFTSQVVRARKPNLTTTRREREQAGTAVPETPVLVPFVSFSFHFDVPCWSRLDLTKSQRVRRSGDLELRLMRGDA